MGRKGWSTLSRRGRVKSRRQQKSERGVIDGDRTRKKNGRQKERKSMWLWWEMIGEERDNKRNDLQEQGEKKSDVIIKELKGR